jgi:hypothetical protein
LHFEIKTLQNKEKKVFFSIGVNLRSPLYRDTDFSRHRCKKSIFLQISMNVCTWRRVARFFFVQYTNTWKNIPNYHKYTKMSIIFHCKAIQSLPKLRFWSENRPSGNPGIRLTTILKHRLGQLRVDFLKLFRSKITHTGKIYLFNYV